MVVFSAGRAAWTESMSSPIGGGALPGRSRSRRRGEEQKERRRRAQDELRTGMGSARSHSPGGAAGALREVAADGWAIPSGSLEMFRDAPGIDSQVQKIDSQVLEIDSERLKIYLRALEIYLRGLEIDLQRLEIYL